MMRHILLLLLSFGLGAHAVPKLSPLFSDNMVIQQNADAPIWGTAKPGKAVTVSCSWSGTVVTAKAGPDGRWMATVRTPKAGGPHSITVSDGKKVVINGVMAGEVWLCSGQSNMEYPVKGWTSVLNADEELANSVHPGIRLLQVHKVASVAPSARLVTNSPTWQVCGPSTLPEFSAIAYFFAREISAKEGVPVGVIDATWGGSNIESWISAETLRLMPDCRDSIDRAAYMPWRNSPAALYNGMISPLVPMAMRGVLWYQGEQNELRGWQYRDLFTMLIRDWRRKWHADRLPFYFVQLANFHERRNEPVEALWAELREAQDMALRLPATGMASAIDVGLGNDVHYPNKQEVARRLSLIALANIYGHDCVFTGPRYMNHIIGDSRVLVEFSDVAGGLVQRGGHISGFTVAGPDHVWHNAEARIVDGGAGLVEVWADGVIMPVAVRYLWQDNPEVTLYNGAGLPACPFRTDDWPLLSYGKYRSNSDY